MASVRNLGNVAMWRRGEQDLASVRDVRDVDDMSDVGAVGDVRRET
jgi:hypothetical protein